MDALTAAVAVALILQLLDVHSTRAFLAQGHREANPLIRWAMKRLGGVGWIAFKLALGGAGIFAMWQAQVTLLLWAFNAGMTWVVLRNYRLARG